MGRRGRVGMSPKAEPSAGSAARGAGAALMRSAAAWPANVFNPQEAPLQVRRDERPGATLPEMHVAESRGMARPVLVSIDAERFILRQEFALLSRTQLVAHLPPGDRVVSEQPWRVARNSSAGAAERGQRPPNR
jgi:hypothetical protein